MYSLQILVMFRNKAKGDKMKKKVRLIISFTFFMYKFSSNFLLITTWSMSADKRLDDKISTSGPI